MGFSFIFVSGIIRKIGYNPLFQKLKSEIMGQEQKPKEIPAFATRVEAMLKAGAGVAWTRFIDPETKQVVVQVDLKASGVFSEEEFEVLGPMLLHGTIFKAGNLRA